MREGLLRLARALGLFRVCRWLTRKHLRVLCYHGIWIGPAPHYGDRLFMSAQRFRERMALIERCGYRVIPLAEAERRHARGETRGDDVVITIDDAWIGTYLHMLPELERRGYPATLYVPTYYAGAQRPVLNVLLGYLCSRPGAPDALEQLQLGPGTHAQRVEALVARVEALPTLNERWADTRRLAAQLAPGIDIDALGEAFRLMDAPQLRDAAARGIDVQLHTHTHRMHGHDAALVEREIALNRAALSTMLGRPAEDFVHFCYPSGDFVDGDRRALQSCGVRSATTTRIGLVSPGSNPYAMPRILDGESMSEIELEAMLSGFWSLALRLRDALRAGSPRT